jgi:PRTRC genetic system protein B
MQIDTAIGENYHFALHEALLVYRTGTTSFVTRHDVTQQKDMPPVLGPAQPLTVGFIDSLVRSVRGNLKVEVLPENILTKNDRMIAWWTPQRRRVMFYNNSEGKAKEFNGKVFPQPPLVWLVLDGSLHIRALVDNKRPDANTKLAVAPFWNLSSDGTVCTGSMRRPKSPSVASIASWEQGFYESNFTHSNVGRLTRHKDGFDGLWTALAGQRHKFPSEALILLPETLSQFIVGGR